MTRFSGILSENGALCIKIEFENKFYKNEFSEPIYFSSNFSKLTPTAHK